LVLTREVSESTASFTKLSSVKVGQAIEISCLTARELVQLGFARFRGESDLAGRQELSKREQVKLRELERTESLVRDIVNCRIRKIVSLAASPTPSEEL